MKIIYYIQCLAVGVRVGKAGLPFAIADAAGTQPKPGQ